MGGWKTPAEIPDHCPRDLNSGKVLFVGDGKGCDALLPFNRKMRQFRGNIKAVCMDMSNAYAKWAREQFPATGRFILSHSWLASSLAT
ncbi:transposase [Oligosphaera ethanolica]|uniref:Transposase IS204/IS1001/IS1096/IS1165 DDE domain-containing protein n=1 Tax=Oligosphaera ethanolica TaxID=760260 RepID=A0AAE3VH13_9BACT|nr:hypothetical protein [Oligosphaera ethanolica]